MIPLSRPTGPEILEHLDRNDQTPSVRTHTDPIRQPADEAGTLVGRTRHLEEIENALATVRSGKPAAALIHGRSGAGKSCLIRNFLLNAKKQDDVIVLAGQCYEQESVPFKALDNLVDSLSQFLRTRETNEVATLLPRNIHALARVFPVLQRVETIKQMPSRGTETPDQQELRRRAFTALRELLARISDRYLLILHIDDLQWGDANSATQLCDILLPPDPPALLLLCSFRSEYIESSECVHNLLEGFQQNEALELYHIEVGPLSDTDACELASAMLINDKSSSLVKLIARESGGNPYFIRELVQYVNSGSSIQSENINLNDVVVWARIQNSPVSAQQLLKIAAVAGIPLKLNLLLSVSDVSSDLNAALAFLSREQPDSRNGFISRR